MPPLLSGTHTLISFSPKLTGPNEQYQHLEKGSENFTWQSKSITPRRMLSSAFSWWGFGEVQKKKRRRRSGGLRKKKIPVQLLRPWRDLEALSIACEGLFEWNGGRKGENELSILITQACDSALAVWQAPLRLCQCRPCLWERLRH